MSLSVDKLSYNESRTSKGNPYRECRFFRDAAIVAPICVGSCIDSFSGFALEAVLEKRKVPYGKYKWLIFLGGIAIDTFIALGIGGILDKIVTKKRMKKADKLAEKQKI